MHYNRTLAAVLSGGAAAQSASTISGQAYPAKVVRCDVPVLPVNGQNVQGF
jgi:hypothetical protein